MKFSIPGTIPRAALVTGGMQQIAIVNALAEAGFAVALQYHPGAELGHPGAEADLPAHAIPLPADLSDEAQTASLLGRATEALGVIGVLVNAASAVERDSWADATRATWDMHIDTNLRAPFVLIQHFAKALPPPPGVLYAVESRAMDIDADHGPRSRPPHSRERHRLWTGPEAAARSAWPSAGPRRRLG
jgi:NAD(P)-dependent dehydrogenase (short-subunit alcohol dehydrogenase family)